MALVGFAIWRIGKSVFAAPPAGESRPSMGMIPSGHAAPLPLPLPLPAPAPAPAPVTVMAPAPVAEPVVRFVPTPARIAKGSTPPPMRAIPRVVVAPAPAPALPRRSPGQYHLSRPAHGLDEVPRRRR